MRRQRTIKAWGGFSDGKMFWLYPPNDKAAEVDYGSAAIYKYKADAKRAFEDVRPVTITFEEGP